MNTKEQLASEIEKTPETLLSEVFDFVHFLKAKTFRESSNTAMMSQSLLGKNWLGP